MDSTENIIKSDIKIDILSAQRSIDQELVDLARFLDHRSKKGYSDDSKLAEDLFADVFEVLLGISFITPLNPSTKGYDIYSENLEYAIQISRDDSANKVYKAYVNTMLEPKNHKFKNFIYLSLHHKKTQSKEKTFRIKFERDGILDEYQNLEGGLGKCVWDLIDIGKFRITDPEKLRTLLGIYERYKSNYRMGNPVPYRRHLVVNSLDSDQPLFLDKLDNSTSSWAEYFGRLNKQFEPICIFPRSILNNIRRNGKRLFVNRYQGQYYVKDESFIKEIKENTFLGNTLNNTLLGNGINKVRLYRSSKLYKIETTTDSTCPICSLYNFCLPLEFIDSKELSIRKAYVQYLLGDTINAHSILTQLSQENTFIGCLATLGLIRLQRADYFLSDKVTNYQETTFRDYHIKVKASDLYNEQIKVLSHLKERNYWDKQYFLLEKLFKISNKVRLFSIDQKGELINIIIECWTEMNQLVRTASHNLLIRDLAYTNVTQLFGSLFHCIIQIGEKFDLVEVMNLNLRNLKNFLLHLRADELSKITTRYRTSKIFRSEQFLNDFSDQIDDIESIFKALLHDNYHVPIFKYVVNYLGNVLVLLEFTDNPSSIVTDLINQYISLIEKEPRLGRELENQFTELLHNYYKEIDNDILIKGISFYEDNWRVEEISKILEAESTQLLKLELSQFVLKSPSLSNTEIEKYKAHVKLRLEKKFEPRYFRNAIVFKCVKVNDFRKNLISELQKQYNNYEEKDPFQYQQAKHFFRLLVEAMYNDDEVLDINEISCLEISEPYFRWLLNPKIWSYDNFDIYFISDYNSKTFFKYFAGIPILKKKIEDYLKTKDDRNLRYIYFNYFHNQSKPVETNE